MEDNNTNVDIVLLALSDLLYFPSPQFDFSSSFIANMERVIIVGAGWQYSQGNLGRTTYTDDL